MTNNWTTPQRPNDYTEQALVQAILDGSFAVGSSLPGERTLAAELGVTRPTLREAIQRLTRDGWLTVHHGKPTLVNDYWRDGGLNVLSTLVQHSDQLPPNFVANLLDVRLHLAPAYTRAAVDNDPTQPSALLNQAANLPDTAVAFATFDWTLHHCLTVASGNPIYTLILNGFANFYEQIAQLYFALPNARGASRAFYEGLATAVANQDALTAETLTRQVMEQSIVLWESSSQ
ncbi:MAG: fatty acid metabolism transcriptional regulator FadR [Ardenticatenaceae bacterium]|nr:fatty acid metabolism transcriptional regulator FadR [Anaerolineales bacterium]MCB8923520.1 fatty acid metabolism transcriptional regulator FadR [Ardenticatenaceae bacterium]MCB8991909.1 fatty acid metabolism transcriptional regulator FadR [Ardenticatenaceae bacterium]MCB9003755.1 fatty acid metabolism transcriptional regulator FadR [Ardenticatenaceae bacterium]